MPESSKPLRAGDSLSFHDREDLLAQLARLPQKAPRRTGGRRSEDEEGYCIIRYLRAAARELSFPCTLTKSERPDFLLDEDGRGRTAIEVTRVTTETHERALTELERRPKGTVLMGESYLREPGRPLVGRVPAPEIGNEPEERVAQIALARVEAKTRSLNRPDYQQADGDYLLLYDNSHYFPDLAVAAPLLANGLGQLSTRSLSRRFSRVALLAGDLLILEAVGWRILPVPDPMTPNLGGNAGPEV